MRLGILQIFISKTVKKFVENSYRSDVESKSKKK